MDEYIPDELELFDDQKVQIVVESSQKHLGNPVNSIENSTIIEFRDLGLPGIWKDLDQLYIQADIQVQKSDGGLYKEADELQGRLCNNSLLSLIKSASLSLNNVNVANLSETFAQREYIQSILNYNTISCKNKLAMQGLFPIEDEEKELREMTRNSKICKLKAKFNICNTGRYLLPNVDVYIKIELANPNFYMIEEKKGETVSKSKLSIKNMKLCIKYIKASETYNFYNERKLSEKSKNAIYEHKGAFVMTYTIPTNTTSLTFPSLFIGNRPALALIYFCKSSAFMGNVLENPYKFEMFNMTSFNFIIGGVSEPPVPFSFKSSENEQNIVEMFSNLYEALDMLDNNESCLVNLKNFSKQNFLIALDLTSNGFALTNIVEPFKNSSLGFSATFSKATEFPITALLYILRPRRFEISASRVVESVY